MERPIVQLKHDCRLSLKGGGGGGYVVHSYSSANHF